MLSPIAKRACGAVEIFSLFFFCMSFFFLFFCISQPTVIFSLPRPRFEKCAAERQNKCFFQQEVKWDVNQHQTASREWHFRVAPGVANQMSGVSCATPDTFLAPPLLWLSAQPPAWLHLYLYPFGAMRDRWDQFQVLIGCSTWAGHYWWWITSPCWCM